MSEATLDLAPALVGPTYIRPKSAVSEEGSVTIISLGAQTCSISRSWANF